MQEQRPLTCQLPVTVPPDARKSSGLDPTLQQTTGQSVQAPNVSTVNMLNVVTVVQQIMSEVIGALSQKEKIVAITKIVSKLMNQNDH
jgi:hypothetical protein